MRYKFIIKPPLKKEVEKEILKLQNENEVEFEFTEKEGEKNAKNLVKKAIESNFERIILVGGDGLVGEGVNGAMEMKERTLENFSLGIIPTGSGNNFAKSLKIPKKIEKAFEIIKLGKKISVDVGRVNEKYFINCFSLGFDAKINNLANKIKEKYHFLPKELSYLFSALKEILIRIPDYEIEIRGENINLKERLVLVAITNSESYGGIFKINPGAKISDGKLNLCLIFPLNKIKALKTLFLATKGKHTKAKEVRNFEFSKPIKIFSAKKTFWETDGEVFLPGKEFEIKIFPKALNFICPYGN